MSDTAGGFTGKEAGNCKKMQLDEKCADCSTHQLGGMHNSCGEDNNVIKRIKWSVIKFRPRSYEQVELPESGRKKYSYLRACEDGIPQ